MTKLQNKYPAQHLAVQGANRQTQKARAHKPNFSTSCSIKIRTALWRFQKNKKKKQTENKVRCGNRLSPRKVSGFQHMNTWGLCQEISPCTISSSQLMWCTWNNWRLAFLTPTLQAGPREVPISLHSPHLTWDCLGAATDGCLLCCFPYSQGKPWGAESADIKGLHLAEHSPECKQTRSDALFPFHRQLSKESVAFQRTYANTVIWTEIKFLEHCRYFYYYY